MMIWTQLLSSNCPPMTPRPQKSAPIREQARDNSAHHKYQSTDSRMTQTLLSNLGRFPPGASVPALHCGAPGPVTWPSSENGTPAPATPAALELGQSGPACSSGRGKGSLVPTCCCASPAGLHATIACCPTPMSGCGCCMCWGCGYE